MYAVLRTGGKQYRVSKGDKLKVEKLPGAVGEEITFDDILMIGGTEDIMVGTPRVQGAKVAAKILAHDRSKKVIVFKFKRRKGYQKKQGHRQNYTHVEITDIQAAKA